MRARHVAHSGSSLGPDQHAPSIRTGGNKALKITKLRILRYLGLSDFSAEPGEHVNIVSGANGKGKTSFLRAIMDAVTGGRKDPWVIYRKGNRLVGESDAAEILVELDGAMNVRRRIAPTGSDIQVTKKEGGVDVEIRSPQAFLNGIVGSMSLNPVEFFSASAADKRRILLAAVPAILKDTDLGIILTQYIDETSLHAFDQILVKYDKKPIGLVELQEIEISLMERRHAAWNEKEHHEEAAITELMKLPPDYKPTDFPDFKDIMARHDAAMTTVRSRDAKKNAVEMVLQSKRNASGLVAELERRLEQARKHEAETDEILAKAQDELLDATGKLIDLEPIRAELQSYEANKRWRDAFIASVQHENSRDAAADRVRAYDQAMQRGIRVDAPALLWSRLEGTPLGGLDVKMEGQRITVGGVDIDGLSSSEQIRLAVRIARATAGALKVICVDGIEALDPKVRSTFYKEAAADDFQYFVTEVTEGELAFHAQL